MVWWWDPRVHRRHLLRGLRQPVGCRHDELWRSI